MTQQKIVQDPLLNKMLHNWFNIFIFYSSFFLILIAIKFIKSVVYNEEFK
jgi:hypothetical protein